MPWHRNQDWLARPEVPAEAREGADIVTGWCSPSSGRRRSRPRHVARRRRADAAHRERARAGAPS